MSILFTREERRCLNFFRINIILVVLTIIFPFKIAGFSLVGYSWTLFFFYSVFILLRNKSNFFPIHFYLPWIIYLGVYLIIDFSFRGFQSTLQYICPLIAGMGASGFTYSEKILIRLLKFCKIFALILFVLGIVLPNIFGLNKYFAGNAALVITSTLIITILASEFFILKNTWNLVYFLILFLIPFIGVNRMALLMSLVVLPLNFAPIQFGRRIFFLAIIIIIGVLVFYSPRVQEKMFFSGSGKLTDLNWENTNLYSGGRTALYKAIEQGIKDEPVWGLGPRSDLNALEEAGLEIKEVHNDYLSVRFNYGWVGLSLLLLAFLLQIIDLIRLNRYKWTPLVKIYSASSLTLFIPLFGLMYTDNILKYTIFFSTFHFIFIGIVHSIYSGSLPKKRPGIVRIPQI